MGNDGREQAFGVNSGGMEREHGVAVGGHSQPRPKCGKFLADVGVVEMVCCRSIRAPR